MINSAIFFVLLVINLLLIILLCLSLKKFNSNSNNNTYSDSLLKNVKDEFVLNRKELLESNSLVRKESNEVLLNFQNSINIKLDNFTKNTNDSLTLNLTNFMQLLSNRLDSLTSSTQENLRNQQKTVDSRLQTIQASNEKKLDEMRQVVDEKLSSTLEKRLASSFELVGRQLEAVQKGLGEMQNLASDVGGLKRALVNVKTAGSFGEVRLEALLEEILSPEQFEKNAHPNLKNPSNVVEFAVKIPSKDIDDGFIYLPLDSKYPSAVWDKLSCAYENADKVQIEEGKKELERKIKTMAKEIKEKYIDVPYTTDFAIMFLPFESLFAEVTRIPGLFQTIQDEYKVTIVSPTTLSALLNSLQMGFRTLMIQKSSSQLWELVIKLQSEFGTFGDVLNKTKERLNSALNDIDKCELRSRAIEKQLKKADSIGIEKSLN